MQGSRLYVGNLPYSVDDEHLKELFAKYGEVVKADIISGKGFGFVEMSNPEAAEKAKTELNDTEFEGRKLRVDEARPPRSRSFGPQGGGYGSSRGGYNSGGTFTLILINKKTPDAQLTLSIRGLQYFSHAEQDLMAVNLSFQPIFSQPAPFYGNAPLPVALKHENEMDLPAQSWLWCQRLPFRG